MSSNSNKNSITNNKIQNNLSGDEPEYEPEKWNRVLKDYQVDTKLMDQNEFKKYKKIMAIIQDIHNCYAYSSDYISTKNISTCEKILDKNRNREMNKYINCQKQQKKYQKGEEYEMYQQGKLLGNEKKVNKFIKNINEKCELKQINPCSVCKGMKPQPGYPSYIFLKYLVKKDRKLLQKYDLTKEEIQSLMKFYTPVKKTNKKSIYKCSKLMGRTIGDTPGAYITDKDTPCRKGTSKSALVISPKTPIYHYYRQNNDGTWSHKDGSLPSTNLDSKNRVITDLEKSNKNYTPDKRYKNNILDYTDFCGYYCMPRNSKKILKPDINSIRKGFLYGKNIIKSSKQTKKSSKKSSKKSNKKSSKKNNQKSF